jgi:hypothetical protein
MNRHDFRNAICCLHHIDAHQLVASGIIRDGDGKAWQRFASNPEAFFLRLDDARAEALWGLVARQMQRQQEAA